MGFKIVQFSFQRSIEEIKYAVLQTKKYRSWASARKAYLVDHDCCELCGYKKNLNVHHIQPRHLFPELELEPSNFVTLCRECHFRYGHKAMGWKVYDPTVHYLKVVMKNYRVLRDVDWEANPQKLTCPYCGEWLDAAEDGIQTCLNEHYYVGP